MSKLIALLQFLLALAGYPVAGTSYSSHALEANGASAFGKARVQDGVARFECVDSSSGLCHFTLYPRNCADQAACKRPPLRSFSVARGDSRQIAGLSGFRLCVDPGAAALDPQCKPLATTAPH